MNTLRCRVKFIFLALPIVLLSITGCGSHVHNLIPSAKIAELDFRHSLKPEHCGRRDRTVHGNREL